MDISKDLHGRCNRTVFWSSMFVWGVVTCGIFLPQVFLFEQMSEVSFRVLMVIDFFYAILSTCFIAFMTIRRINDTGINHSNITIPLTLTPVVAVLSHYLHQERVGYAIVSCLFFYIVICCSRKSCWK